MCKTRERLVKLILSAVMIALSIAMTRLLPQEIMSGSPVRSRDISLGDDPGINGALWDVNRIDITTPNNDHLVKTAYQIREDSGMAFGMRSDNAEVATLFQLPEDTFEQAICFTSMNTTPDIMVLAKLADGADETAVKEALEAHRQSQHDTFSWYLAQNLPKVEDARSLVEDGYVFYLIAENADAGEAAFHAYVEAQA